MLLTSGSCARPLFLASILSFLLLGAGASTRAASGNLEGARIGYGQLNGEQQRLCRTMAHGLAWAKAFAASNNLALRPNAGEAPKLIFATGGPSQVAALAGLSRVKGGQTVVARCDLLCGRIYLGRMRSDDLLHELGHWYFGSSEKVADRFMTYALKREKGDAAVPRDSMGAESIAAYRY